MNELVQNKVHKMVSDLVRMSVDEIDIDENLLEMGADSILIAELNGHIKSEFGVEIPMNLYFNDTTSVSDIAEYVSEHISIVEITKHEETDKTTAKTAIDEHSTKIPKKVVFDDMVDKEIQNNFIINQPNTYSMNESSLISLLQQQVQMINNQLVLLQNGKENISFPIWQRRVERAADDNSVQALARTETDVANNAVTEEKAINNDKYDHKNAYVPFKALNLEKKQLDEERNNCLRVIQKQYTEKTKSSKVYAAKYRKSYADCRSVSGFRPNIKEMCYQLIFKSSNGAYITDIDDNQYIDLAMDFGVSLFGHNQDFINAAITEEMKKGYPLSLVSGLSGEVASLFCELTEMERAAFFNSGTEAVMVAVRIARAYTNRKKVVIFAGSYHGTFDGVLGMSSNGSDKATPAANGILEDFVNNLVILDYGSNEALEYVEKNKEQIAAVLVEPVQSRRPDLQPYEFIHSLRELTEKEGIILIFDEMILGFRLGKRGAQGFYGIQADMATYGKICGGGLPVGIVAGKEKYMNCIDGGLWNYGDETCPPDEDKRTFVAGTFSHHPLAMAASKAVLTKIKEAGDEIFQDINKKTVYLCTTLNQYFSENDIPISMSYCGSLFRFILKGNLELFYYLLNLKGVYIWEGRNCFISASHTYDDLNKVIDAVKWACNELKPFYGKKDSLQDKKILCTREQREIIAYEQMSTGVGMNETCLVKVKGNILRGQIEKAYRQVCKRHEILSYHLSADMVYFVENEKPEFEVIVEKCTEDSIMSRCLEIAKIPFDLRKDILIRMYFFEVSEEITYIFMSVHHVLVDGWSISVVLQEIIEAYNALTGHRTTKFREAMDYSSYLHELSKIPVSAQAIKDIQEYIKGGFEYLILPESDENDLDNINKIVLEETDDSLDKFRNSAKKLKCSTFVFLLTGFQSMLHLVTNKNLITVGIPYAGQQKFIMNSLVGNCTKVNKLKAYIDGGTLIEDVVKNNKRVLKLYSETFIQEFDEVYNSEDTVNIIFNTDQIPNSDTFRDAEISLVPLESQDSAYDLFVNISEFSNRIIFETSYNSRKYSEAMVSRWMDVYLEILNQLTNNKCTHFCDFDIVNTYDRNMAIEVSKKLNTKELEEKLNILPEQYDFDEKNIAVVIKNNRRLPVITGSYGYLYVGKTIYTGFATDYIGRISHSGKLEVLGREKECFSKNGRLVGCYMIKEKLKESADFAYIDVAYENGELVVYFDSADPEKTVKLCTKNLDYIYRPDRFYLCTSRIRSSANQFYVNCFEGNATELMIYEKVSEILQNKNMGIDDNVTDYGLTSLKLIHLISEIQSSFDGIRISIAELDGNYTIRGLGKLVDSLKSTGRMGIPSVKKDSEIEERGILSSSQKRMYVLNQLHPEEINYNLPYLICIDGLLDKSRLISAVEECMEIHPMLRARYYEDDGKIRYRTDGSTENIIKWENYYGEENEEEYIAHKMEEFVVPFSLLESNLFRMRVVIFRNTKNIIFVDFHHINFDGMSANILIGDLCDLYNGLMVKKSEYLYDSYYCWQEELKKTDFYNSELTFWKNRLNTNYSALDMLRNLSAEDDKNSDCCGESIINISNNNVLNLRENAKKLGCTLFSVISAAASIMLSLYSGEKEFAIGTVVEGRNDIAFNNIIGMFVNTLPLLQSVDDTLTIEEFIKKSNQNNLEAFANSDVPFEKIVELGNIKIVNNRNPIFNFLITYHDNEVTEISLGDMMAKIRELPIATNRFELELVVNCSQDDIALKLLYTKKLYSDENIARMMKTLEKILEAFSIDISCRLNEIQYCDVNALRSLNPDLDRTFVGYPTHENIVSMFEEQVEKWPDRTAIIFQDKTYTYSQLNERANQLANTLLTKGIKMGELVVIVTERSIKMIVGIIAIIKTGGVYVPIDPIYPKERKSYIIEDSNAAFVLKGNVEIECSEDKKVIDLFSELNYSENRQNPKVDITPENGIYVIYTSGTTGNPKGVLIEHKNVVRLMRNDRFKFDFDENDCWTMFHSFCFDFSVWEMYGALLFGGKLVIPARDITQNSSDFIDLIEKENVTVLNQVPSAFYQLMRAEEERGDIRLQSLRYLIFGGEALDPGRLKDWHKNHPDAHIINMYGITETTVHVTYKEIGDNEIRNGISDIGLPIPTLGIYIMRGKQLCDIGMPGEICVYGEGLGRGYLNREELTAQKFVKNPYDKGRLYCSGDLARLLPSGEIEYLGRIDQQIKIRGFRIELEEIEVALRGLTCVREAVVIIKKRVSDENAIHAYIVSDETVDFTDIRKQLKNRLPDYMLPAYFCQIDEIPLTLNGKLNRKALPDIILSGGKVDEPRNEIEKQVKKMFIDVLNMEEIGIHDNFFYYGGHSIKAVEVINEVRKNLGVSISLDTFFNNGTIENIAKIIEEKTYNHNCENRPILTAEGVTEGVLSLNQKELYGASIIEQNPEVYNICYPIILNNIQLEVVEKTIKILLERHSILRTQLFEKNDEELQRIMSADDCMGKIYKYIYKENETWNKAKLEQFINIYVGYRFEMLDNYLLRIHLIKIDQDKYLMIYLTHHIISDAWSFRVFMKDFISVYISLAEGKNIELDDLPVQYIDYAIWQRKLLKTGEFMQKEADYWSEILSGNLPNLNLHTDFERQYPRSMEGSSIDVQISNEQLEQLRKISVKHHGSVFTAFVSCVNILMYMYTGQNDLILGTIVAGRNDWKLEPQIGYYLNVLPIRTRFEMNASVEDVIEATSKACAGAFENQDYPYEKIVSEVRANNKKVKGPLFDILVQYVNWNDSYNGDAKMQFEVVDMKSEQSKYDLVFNFVDMGGQTKLVLEYCTKLFHKETIENMIRRLQTVMQEVLSEENISIDKINHRLTQNVDSVKVKKIWR